MTAADGTTQAYTVTVTVALNPAKAITAYSFQGLVPAVVGAISEAEHRIALTVPFGNSVKFLKATFATTGSSVRVGATIQQSGFTENDFTSPVTYTVTAADGTTEDYIVTVTVPVPAIGDSYGGGKVAYILQDGDPGYVEGETHGLVAALADQSASMAWSNIVAADAGAAGVALGTGQANTTAIVSQVGCVGGAAYLCDHLTEGGFSDWYLPSKDELNLLYLSQGAIGGFGPAATGVRRSGTRGARGRRGSQTASRTTGTRASRSQCARSGRSDRRDGQVTAPFGVCVVDLSRRRDVDIAKEVARAGSMAVGPALVAAGPGALPGGNLGAS